MQKTVALSMAEAEYYSASVETIYLRGLLSNMRLPEEGDTPVYEDNTACIEWANHVMGGRERAKHIDIRKHFAHEAVQNGHMRLHKIATEDQLADISRSRSTGVCSSGACSSCLDRTRPRPRSGTKDLALSRG